MGACVMGVDSHGKAEIGAGIPIPGNSREFNASAGANALRGGLGIPSLVPTIPIACVRVYLCVCVCARACVALSLCGSCNSQPMLLRIWSLNTIHIMMI